MTQFVDDFCACGEPAEPIRENIGENIVGFLLFLFFVRFNLINLFEIYSMNTTILYDIEFCTISNLFQCIQI